MKKIISIILIMSVLLSLASCKRKADTETDAMVDIETPATEEYVEDAPKEEQKEEQKPEPEPEIKQDEKEEAPKTEVKPEVTQKEEPEKEPVKTEVSKVETETETKPETEVTPKPEVTPEPETDSNEVTLEDNFSPYEVVIALTEEEGNKNLKYTLKDFEKYDVYNVYEDTKYVRYEVGVAGIYKSFSEAYGNKRILHLYINDPSKQKVLDTITELEKDERVYDAFPLYGGYSFAKRVFDVYLKEEYETKELNSLKEHWNAEKTLKEYQFPLCNEIEKYNCKFMLGRLYSLDNNTLKYRLVFSHKESRSAYESYDEGGDFHKNIYGFDIYPYLKEIASNKYVEYFRPNFYPFYNDTFYVELTPEETKKCRDKYDTAIYYSDNLKEIMNCIEYDIEDIKVAEGHYFMSHTRLCIEIKLKIDPKDLYGMYKSYDQLNNDKRVYKVHIKSGIIEPREVIND